jgi:hypothetical protein
MLLLLVLCRTESMGSTTAVPSRSLRHGSLLLAVRRVIAIIVTMDLLLPASFLSPLRIPPFLPVPLDIVSLEVSSLEITTNPTGPKRDFKIRNRTITHTYHQHGILLDLPR